QILDKVQLPARKHRDFVNDEDLASLHAIEPGEDGLARIATKHGVVIFVRLPGLRPEEHPAKPVNRHAAYVQRPAPRRPGTTAFAAAFLKEAPQQRAFPRASHAAKEHVASAVRRAKEPAFLGNFELY